MPPVIIDTPHGAELYITLCREKFSRTFHASVIANKTQLEVDALVGQVLIVEMMPDLGHVGGDIGVL
jgi:hypothetical protein